jgi:hypothetical protein
MYDVYDTARQWRSAGRLLSTGPSGQTIKRRTTPEAGTHHHVGIKNNLHRRTLRRTVSVQPSTTGPVGP